MLAVLGLLTWQALVPHGPVDRLDATLRDAVQSARDGGPGRLPGVETLAQLLSDIGDTLVSVPLLLAAAVAAAVLARRRRLRWWVPAVIAPAALVVLMGTVVPGKVLVARPGPDGERVVPGGWGWFPSGHTATASVCLGTGLLLLLPYILRPVLRRVLVGLLALVLLGVGAGLVWCNFHWVSDVVASWCLAGTVWWCAAVAQLRLLRRRPD
ncbi:hypothetical protein BIV57_22345 [Mangrovactinospora gilvigrisea]|uniref:Phosphatidic acid phosphatase type 2/haloperoxidase domain-containing protein n=1 Tax=Mangrovactinospora gilvigrisea TaxID=1428644 RepID=A0A1J7BPB4_9ACTN|nr:hypothetical protein BIV57_22345 [Mangrovactinospora gilvigrisea]